MAERNWQRQYRLSKRLWHYQSIRLDHDDARALRELAKIALQALLELPLGLFRRRYLAVPDHGLGELHRSGGIDVFAMHGVAMGEAAAAGVLDASTPARGGPFHAGPDLAVDGEVVMGDPAMVSISGFDDAKAAPVGGVTHHVSLLKFPSSLRFLPFRV